jgi:hypothetical protein
MPTPTAVSSAELVLACIRKHRERLDFEILAETGLPVSVVREHGAALVASGAVIACEVTRFDSGAPIDAWLYRVAGYIPPPAPGRRTKQATTG